MAKNPFGWIEIYVQDMDRAASFYTTVLKLELTPLPAGPELTMMAFPMDPAANGAAGALVKMEGAPSGGNSTIAYFQSEDCADEGSRVVAAGGKIFKDKFSIGEYGFIVLAFDTEGNMFGVHSMK